MLTYIDYIVYSFKAGHEQVRLPGKPQVLQDYFSSYFMFLRNYFCSEACICTLENIIYV